MKNLYLLLASLMLLSSLGHAATTYNGSSLVNTPSLTVGQIGVYLVSLDGTSFTSANLAVSDSADITSSAAYASSFQVLHSGTVFSFGDTQLGASYNVTYGGGIDPADAFAVLVFDANNPTGGTNYQIWTDASWTLPADAGGTLTYGSEITQKTGLDSFIAGTVIPEPSALMLVSLIGLMFLRRRRNV